MTLPLWLLKIICAATMIVAIAAVVVFWMAAKDERKRLDQP